MIPGGVLLFPAVVGKPRASGDDPERNPMIVACSK